MYLRHPFADSGNHQRVSGSSKLERTVVGDDRLDATHQLRETGARLNHIELGGCIEGSLNVVRPLTEGIGQRKENAMYFFGLLLLEGDDVVVDLDSLQRLEKHTGARCRHAVDDARDGRAVFGSDDQHVAAVAVGDDLLLQVLGRVTAAQKRLQCVSQPCALFPKAPADVAERRAGLVYHIARRRDLSSDVGDLLFERRRSIGDGAQQRERGTELRDRCAGMFDRLEVVGEREQARRFERAPLDCERVDERLEIGWWA